MVTLEEFKTHLRIEHADEDEYLGMLLSMAKVTAENFCMTRFIIDNPPEPVRLAVLLHASHFYTNRENGSADAYRTMMRAFQSLLWPYRNTEKLV